MVRYQKGMGLPVFQGTRLQRGRGLGSFLGGLARVAVPILKKTARHGSQEALKAGLEIAKDVSQGQSLKKAIRKRGIEAIKRTVQKTLQNGEGKRIKKKRKKKSVSSRNAKQQRTSLNSDIFGKYRS